MRSLQESLFDDNIKKNVTIREVCCLLAGNKGVEVYGFPVGQMFNPVKLLHYPNPYYPDILQELVANLLGIIVDEEPPTKGDFNVRGQSKWGENLKKKLGKYVKNYWKQEWEEKVQIIINHYRPDLKIFSVEIDFDHGGGVFRFMFKMNDAPSGIYIRTKPYV